MTLTVEICLLVIFSFSLEPNQVLKFVINVIDVSLELPGTDKKIKHNLLEQFKNLFQFFAYSTNNSSWAPNLKLRDAYGKGIQEKNVKDTKNLRWFSINGGEEVNCKTGNAVQYQANHD